MNQILQVENNKKQHKPVNIKNILLILFAISIFAGLAIGGYYIYTNIMNGNIQLPTFFAPQNTTTITLTKVDRNIITINIQSEKGIYKVTYSLNNGKTQVIEANGETYIEESIVEVPVGENTIYVLAVDSNGKETEKQENIIVEVPKPEIELSVVGNDIKITVTSELELSEIRYKWNQENEKKENMATYENKNLYEKQLEIPIGKNTLTIIATDKQGSTTEKIQTIKGVTKATTQISVEGEYLHFTVIGKENIEKVEFVFNGKKYLMNESTFGETKKVHYKVKLIEGANTLTVTSTTQSGGVDTTTREHEYNK